MRKLLKALALTALASGAVGQAQAIDGWYGRVDVGYSIDGQVDLSAFDGEEEISGTADLDNDWMADAGIGYAFQNGFRLEGEIAYRTNDVGAPATGSVDAWSAMLNGFYDFNRGGSIQPYIGAGIGYARVTPDGTDDDSNVAFQGLAGLGFAVSDRLMFDIGYRYFRVNDLEFGAISADYEHQAVTVGLRYQFYAPPPAPAAAAAPPPPPPPMPPPPPPPVACPTAEFTVYFEWDRSNLNTDATATIDRAVEQARSCTMNAVMIIGHTDTSGSNAYNVGLSERRASVVREALVARGVNAALMTSEARGETDLARATGDGVREPLNRRTAVTIRFQ